MKQVKVQVRQKGSKVKAALRPEDTDLKSVLERLKKKELNPMQMCQKLIEHGVMPLDGGEWSYDKVVEECIRLKV